jgi:hypothetical protein
MSHIPVRDLMRRSLTGALVTDPVISDRGRSPRRPVRARRAPDRARVAQAPAPASQS